MRNEKMMQCPYNSRHVFAQSKFFKHISKCKGKYKSGIKVHFCKANSMVTYTDVLAHKLECSYCGGEDPQESSLETSKFDINKTKIHISIDDTSICSNAINNEDELKREDENKEKSIDFSKTYIPEDVKHNESLEKKNNKDLIKSNSIYY